MLTVSFLIEEDVSGEDSLLRELVQGTNSEVLYLGVNAYVCYVFPQNVTVGYRRGVGGDKIRPLVVLCGEEDKIGEVERIVHQNEERIIASQRTFVYD